MSKQGLIAVAALWLFVAACWTFGKVFFLGAVWIALAAIASTLVYGLASAFCKGKN